MAEANDEAESDTANLTGTWRNSSGHLLIGTERWGDLRQSPAANLGPNFHDVADGDARPLLAGYLSTRSKYFPLHGGKSR